MNGKWMPQSGNSAKVRIFDAVKRFSENCKDIFFPIRCVGCRSYGEWICPKCLIKIPFLQDFLCPLCGHFSFLSAACVACSKKSALKGAWACASYQNEIMRQAIGLLKYKGIQDLAKPLSAFAVQYLRAHHIFRQFDALVPVPLHRRKWYYRGYNQSELLAQEFSFYFQCGVLKNALIRRKFTKSQSRQNPEKRVKNVRDAFCVNTEYSLQNKTLLLVDDVMTSASTLSECARVLKEAGVREVWGLVLARG